MITERRQIKVSGIPVEVVRKDIKNLHLAVYPPNGRAREIAGRVLAMVPPEQGVLVRADARYIPRSYARKNQYEFWAEFFTYLREKEKGIEGGYYCSPSFNPPEDIRVVARELFASR